VHKRWAKIDTSSELAHLCPDHVASTAAPKAKTIALLTDRVKELEEKLRRLGQDVRVTTGEQKTPSVNYEADFQTSSADQQSTMLAKPHDMSAMLGRLALGTAASASTKRYAGTEAAPFYLSSPDSSEDEDREAPPPARRKSREVNDISLLVPWSCSGSKRLGNMGDIPGSLLDRCRDMLPSKRVAKELWAAFWEITSWRSVTKYVANRLTNSGFKRLRRPSFSIGSCPTYTILKQDLIPIILP